MSFRRAGQKAARVLGHVCPRCRRENYRLAVECGVCGIALPAEYGPRVPAWVILCWGLILAGTLCAAIAAMFGWGPEAIPWPWPFGAL
jgi:hypothetical protein